MNIINLKLYSQEVAHNEVRTTNVGINLAIVICAYWSFFSSRTKPNLMTKSQNMLWH